MSPIISFFVPGNPAPGGSKTAFVARRGDGSIVMRHGTNQPVINMSDAGGKANKEWRKSVAMYGRNAMVGAGLHGRLIHGPCKVEFVFFIARPRSTHFRTGKFSAELREDAPVFHTKTPDALKFARSTEDALTGIVWADDSQTVRLCAEKRWCNGDDKPGCAIKVVLL